MNAPCLFLQRLGVDDLTVPGPPTMRGIAEGVAERYGLTLADLKSPTQAHRVAHPRQEAMALIYAEGRYSEPQIGRFLNRDASTIHYGRHKHVERLAAAMTVAAA